MWSEIVSFGNGSFKLYRLYIISGNNVKLHTILSTLFLATTFTWTTLFLFVLCVFFFFFYNYSYPNFNSICRSEFYPTPMKVWNSVGLYVSFHFLKFSYYCMESSLIQHLRHVNVKWKKYSVSCKYTHCTILWNTLWILLLYGHSFVCSLSKLKYKIVPMII